ncbi:MAG TPA: sigma 54-interacting transcriptional regulator [Methylomirabilota bacterium]|nr:sigma 54-interacting transcriptional regulator [Methylomirabilota bacterium]
MDPLADIVGDSPGIISLRERVQQILRATARRPPPLLICGETGTGKGLIARTIHQASPRAGSPFVDINCAAIPEHLLEAELFGYERGAFTDARHAKPGLFQVAHRGTVFLDEIALLSGPLQAKLLKFLDDGAVRRLGGMATEAVDVWVISATNADLAAAVRERRFREDLYHRLAVVTILAPPLRERGNDVILLAERFLARACADYGLPPKVLTRDARARLLAHRWPGNVRELSNTMERAALLAETPQVTAALLFDLTEGPPGAARRPGVGLLDEAMRDHVGAVLDQTGGNVSQAAERLGVTRNTLRYHMKKLGLRRGGASSDPRTAGAPAESAVPSPGGKAGVRAVEATSAPAPGVVSFRWERRLITVLGTALAGPKEAVALQFTPALNHLIEKLKSFGARIEELAPDRIVAVFGFEPVEDAPRRAAHAALAMRKLFERLEGSFTQQVTGRFAIHVCRCLIAQSGDVVGMDAADRRAAWSALDALLNEAEPGTILVDASSARFLERRFGLRPAAEVADRGETVYRVVGHERSGFEVGGGALSPFVGRQRELAVLRDLLARAEEGRGQVVGILGEPGVGKSRLLHEFRQSLEPGRVSYLEGCCLSYGNTVPYLPIIDIVRRSLGLIETDPVDVIAAKIQTGLQALGMDPAAAAPYLLHLLGSPERAQEVVGRGPEAIKTIRARTMDVLRQMAIVGSRQRPIIFAVEDLQWIDQTSEEALASLAESLAGCPILLITTYRPGYRPPWLGQSYANLIGLDRLTPANSLEVVHSIVPEQELAQRIVARAEGVPFFLEELARAVADHPELRSDVMVPATVQGVLEARLDRLPDAEKQLLQVASVIGKDVPVALLGAVAGVPEADLRRGLSRLQATEFIYLRRVTPAEEYTFKHALTHDVIYQSLPAPRRQALHGIVGSSIEDLYRDQLDEQTVVLAHHYSRSDQQDRAIKYALLAGDRAARMYANTEATTYYDQALALTRGLSASPERQRAEIDASIKRANVGTTREAQEQDRDNLEQARTLAQTLGDEPRLARVLYWLGRLAYVRGAFQVATDYAEQSLAIADRLGDEDLAAPPVNLMGRSYYLMGDHARAGELLARSVEQMRRLGNTTEEATAAGFAGVALAALGDFRRALSYADHGLRLAETLGNPFVQAAAYNYRAVAYCHQGAGVQAIADCEDARRVAERAGDHFRIYLLQFYEGQACLMVGDPSRARELLESSIAHAKQLGTTTLLAWGQGLLATALLALGQVHLAPALCEEAIGLAENTRDRLANALAHRTLAEALARLTPSDIERAERAVLDAIRIQRELGCRPELARSYLTYARLLHTWKRTDAAKKYIDEALGMFRGMDMARDLAEAEREASGLT